MGNCLPYSQGCGWDWAAFYTELEALGLEASFVQAFGMSSEDFYAEFDAWLDSTNLEGKMAILETRLPKMI